MHRPRQIISENGTPVGIHNNPEHNDYTSFTIGDQDLPLNEHSAQNDNPAVLEDWRMAERELSAKIKEKASHLFTAQKSAEDQVNQPIT